MIRGTISAMVTPLDDAGQLDVRSAQRLALWLIERGIDGIFVGGTTGEGLLLSLDERKQLVEAVVDVVEDRAAVLTQVSCANTADTIVLAEHAARTNVDGIVILSPFFFPVDNVAMLAHFTAVAHAVSDMPILLYNIPGHTRNSISPDVVTALLEKTPNFAGIKDSSKDLVLLQKLVKLAPPDFAVIVGSDSVLLPGLATGAVGVVSAASNVFPEVVVDVVRKFQAGDLEGARTAQQRLNVLLNVLKQGPTLAGYKAGLALRGIPVGSMRPPLRGMNPEEYQRFKAMFEAAWTNPE